MNFVVIDDHMQLNSSTEIDIVFHGFTITPENEQLLWSIQPVVLDRLILLSNDTSLEDREYKLHQSNKYNNACIGLDI